VDHERAIHNTSYTLATG